jgi:phospholipase/carboxylesterase
MMLKRVLFSGFLLALVASTAAWLVLQRLPLSVIARGGSGPPTVVMLHGYGSRAEDWLQFEDMWRLPEGARRVFPQAPLRSPLSGRRGWWWLNLERYVQQSDGMVYMSHAKPGGIKVAARMVREILKKEPQPIVLGGFSQGAMTSAEIAFQSDQELAGLILLGGTTVDEESWAEHFAGRRHLPIFIAHGREDRVLPFAIMDRFQRRLKDFGLNVTWMPFDGGHDIPESVIHGASDFVARVVGLQSAAGRD